MSASVQEVLRAIVARFEAGDIPEAIALSMFPIPNIPAAKWSLLNRTLMFLAGTQDARGYRQWQEAGRQVKKGAKAFLILAPRFRKKIEEEDEEGVILTGFLSVPVFRLEDTEGAPLDYEQLELPELPLLEVAQTWGISVKTIPGNYRYYGYFSQTRQEIALASREECIFFHELAHASHKKVLGQLKPGQDWKQEIVAELAAAVLCKMVGKTAEHLGNAYCYIARYAAQAKLGVAQACLRVMSETEQVLNLILKPAEALASPLPIPATSPAALPAGGRAGEKGGG